MNIESNNVWITYQINNTETITSKFKLLDITDGYAYGFFINDTNNNNNNNNDDNKTKTKTTTTAAATSESNKQYIYNSHKEFAIIPLNSIFKITWTQDDNYYL